MAAACDAWSTPAGHTVMDLATFILHADGLYSARSDLVPELDEHQVI